MAKDTFSLRSEIRVRGRYYRSVQLAKDWASDQAGRDYVATPTARYAAEQILTGLMREGGNRAWSITGPYGTGKSAFGLFLTDLVSKRSPRHMAAVSIRAHFGLGRLRMLPVLVVGQRLPFAAQLLHALADVFRSVNRKITRSAEQLTLSKTPAGDQVVRVFEEATAAARAAGWGGVLLVVDELGKFLEHAAAHTDTQDLMLLQQLAESAARCPVPFVFITILHSAFAEYAQEADDHRRREWRKVQGRFSDIAFLEPADQFVHLIGNAIERKSGALNTTYERHITRELHQPAYTALRLGKRSFADLVACAPLEPSVAMVLGAVFRSKLSQNERSLFTFLTGSEPGGFQHFIDRQTWKVGTPPPLFRLDALYDYIVSALGSAVYTGDRAYTWAQIDQSLARLPETADDLAAPCIKAIGLISMYGASAGLRPTADLLGAALGDPDGVRRSLKELKKDSIVVYRHHKDAYGLWDGSDVDLAAHYTATLGKLGRGNLAARLADQIHLRPAVARAHYIRTGTLRYFRVRISDGSSLTAEPSAAGADGDIVYVIAPSEPKRAEAMQAAIQSTTGRGLRRPQVFVFPEPLSGLEDALRGVEAWRRILETVPELQGDRVARQEAIASLRAAQHQLDAVAGRVFGIGSDVIDPGLSVWIWKGQSHPLRSARDYSEALSTLCDEAFAKAPPLHNELLNRERLSSAAALARRNLIEAMVESEAQENLGMQGYPPEFSMYLSMLKTAKFHRVEGSHYGFDAPRAGWGPTWDYLDRALSADSAERRNIGELFAELQAPPYGLRSGPLPILLTAYVLAHGEACALYEDGVFVPELRIEALERLIRRPETFEVQKFALSSRDRKLFRALDTALAEIAPNQGRGQTQIATIARQLVLFAARLPAYTKQTWRFDLATAAAVRDLLLKARDPYHLLYRDLPAALGVESPASEPEHFARQLREAIMALHRAYPALLEEIERQSRVSFGLQGGSAAVRTQLIRRAGAVAGYAKDKQLALLTKDAALLEAGDWRELVARVVMDGVPATNWKDSDAVAFQVKLIRLASEFVRLEELVAEHRISGAAQILRVGILNGTLEEDRAVIAVPEDRMDELGNLEQMLLQVLESDKKVGRELRLAAVARVAAKLMKREGR